MNQGYWINVAQLHGKDWRGAPDYRHFCSINAGDGLPAPSINVLREVRKRFPMPEFKVDMTHWVCRGTSVDEGQA